MPIDIFEDSGISPTKGIDIFEQSFSTKSNKNILGKLGDFAETYINKPVESTVKPAVGGVISGMEHLAANVANIPRALGAPIPKVRVPESIDPLSYTPENPLSKAFGFGGQMIGEGFGAGKLMGLLGKGAGLSASSPLYKRALLGAATGAAATDEELPGGRLGGALIGGVLPMAYGLTKRAIGQRGIELEQKMKSGFKKMYEDFFSRAENLPGKTKELRVPSQISNKTEDYTNFIKRIKPEYRGAIKKFEQNPTLKNAHEAQSEIGKARRALEKDISKSSQKGIEVGSDKQNAYKASEDLQRRIRGEIMRHFTKIGKPEMASEYGELTRRYATEVPRVHGGSFEQYKAGKISPSKVGRAMLSDEGFAASQSAKKIPGYGVRRSIEPLLPYVKGGATVLGIEELGRQLGLPWLKELAKSL